MSRKSSTSPYYVRQIIYKSILCLENHLQVHIMSRKSSTSPYYAKQIIYKSLLCQANHLQVHIMSGKSSTSPYYVTKISYKSLIIMSRKASTSPYYVTKIIYKSLLCQENHLQVHIMSGKSSTSPYVKLHQYFSASDNIMKYTSAMYSLESKGQLNCQFEPVFVIHHKAVSLTGFCNINTLTKWTL